LSHHTKDYQSSRLISPSRTYGKKKKNTAGTKNQVKCFQLFMLVMV
jgi:hypothetical protein